MTKQHYKTVFISDTHLGTRACNAQALSDFLSSFTCDELYLIGDIIDGWQMAKSSAYFPQAHVNIVRKILTKAKKGTKIKYVIGNHDDFLRKFQDLIHPIGNIEIENEFIFRPINGKTFLITHGDLYDTIVLYHRWLANLGDTLYNFAVRINGVLNSVRSYYGLNYWSLASFLKTRVKSALEFICAYEAQIVKEAKKKGFDGVICGHIHVPAQKIIDGIEYWNDGDWCESCSAIVQHVDGTMNIIYWNQRNASTENSE